MCSSEKKKEEAREKIPGALENAASLGEKPSVREANVC